MSPTESHPLLLSASQLTGCEHYLSRRSALSDEQVASLPTTSGHQRRQDVLNQRIDIIASQLDPTTTVFINQQLSHTQKVEATWDALASGAPLVFDAQLEDNPASHQRSITCMLVKVPDGYVPVIITNRRMVDTRDTAGNSAPATLTPLHTWSPFTEPSYKIRRHAGSEYALVHARDLLIASGFASADTRGALIGIDDDRPVVFDTAAKKPHYDKAFARAVSIARHDTPTQAVRTAACMHCSLWKSFPSPDGRTPGCEDQLRARRDISLIARGDSLQVLTKAGISTIDQMLDLTSAPAAMSRADYSRIMASARAWTQGYSLVRTTDALSAPRADIELDVDTESYGQDGAYLWGTHLRLSDKAAQYSQLETGYKPFVSWKQLPDASEAVTFANFWAWLTYLQRFAAAHDLTFTAYCYSTAAEGGWMHASARRFGPGSEHPHPGIPDDNQVNEFLSSAHWVDMFDVVWSQFMSLEGKGLKKVAPHAGFSWRDSQASGEASVGWYRIAAGFDTDEDFSSEAARQRLLEYNEDDVLATLALREWIESPDVMNIPSLMSTPDPHT